jgi:hypothetical protein
MILRCCARTWSLSVARCSGEPGSLRGAESPLSVPMGKSSHSCTCTKKELCDSSCSRVRRPPMAASESAMARARLEGEMHPKPPLSTSLPPM